MLTTQSGAAHDPARLSALRRLGLRPHMEAFDRLARLAARSLDAPVALVSMVDEDHQVFVGSAGLPDAYAHLRTVPITHSYCGYVVEHGQPLVLDDARESDEFRDHPALRDYGVVSYLGIPLVTGGGHVLGSFCVLSWEPRAWTVGDVDFLTDLAASVMTEVELRHELLERTAVEERASRILESITDAFVALDREWRFTFANRESERLLQRGREELLGKVLWEAFPDAIGTTFEREYRRAVREGATAAFEEYFPPLDSWFAVHAYPSAEGLSVYFHNISDRKRAEAQRAASEAHYRRLATNIPQAVYVVDLEGRFTELNPAAEHILQRPMAGLLGEPFASVITPESLPSVHEVFMRVTSGLADNVAFEGWVRRPSGEERLLAITATAIREGGRIAGMHGIARDITEERATERALRESDERLRQIAENVSDAFWIFTPDFMRTLYVSPAFEEIWGVPLERIYADARTFLRAVHPDDVPGLLDAMERVSHEVMMGVEYRVIRPDGAMRWVLARGYPVADEKGVVTRVVGTAEDITERKSAEAAQREGDRRLRQILQALPVGVVLADAEGRLVWHNPASMRIWGDIPIVGVDGYGEYRGWNAETGELIRAAQWPLARAFRGEEVRGEMADIEAFDGRRKTILMSAVPLRDEAGAITGALLAQEDVTEARAREARQRLLAAALEGLREGICLVTREGEIVYANETYTRILGIDPARIPGVRYQDFVLDEETLREQEANLRAAYEQGRWSGRLRRRRLDDGSEVPIDIVLGRVDNSELLFGIAQDASAEIAREQHLRRAERLASVGTLIGGVAHELNNPLQAIRSFAELMLLDRRDERDREALEIMKRESERMSKIVTDLKQIARSTQEEKSQRGPVDLNEVVRHVLKVQGYRLRTSNIEVREDFASDLPAVLADRSQIEQVVLNLVINAEQAMVSYAGRGSLTLRTRASAAGASLHVVDNGPGIPADQLERIFDPFFTTKLPGEGTGLGLSLAHSIVAEHGGEIRVDSQRGAGTSFRVDLPRAPEQTPQPDGEGAERAPPAPLRILVVDDEPSVRMVMALYLERRGHEVDEAADGAAALKLLERATYDVILSDIRMPGLGGEAMMECLTERGLSSRVIFMTGDAAGAGARLGQAGVPVLLKPIKLEEVARAVEGHANR